MSCGGGSAGRPVSEKRLSQSLQLLTVGDESVADLAEDALTGRGRGGPGIAEDALVGNNVAAALLLAGTALRGLGSSGTAA